MKEVVLRGIKVFTVKDKSEIINYIKYKKGILIAINAEKILRAKDSLVDIIKNNIGYPDGIGLEWLYRLIKQPSRIKRQIILVKFLWYVSLNRL